MDNVLVNYNIKKVEEKGELKGYILTGPRGAEYFLMQNHYDKHLLFVVAFGRKTQKLAGYTWFTDKSGELKPVR